MLPNTYPDLQKVINESEIPILIYLTLGPCGIKTDHQTRLEQMLTEMEVNMIFYVVCVEEHNMKFPRFATPALYFFIPQNQTPVFWRDQAILGTIKKDVEIINKMMTGLSYEEASLTELEKEKVLQVEYFLKEEEKNMDAYPSSFQMVRNAAKEVWENGKRAARGLPILVPAEVGFSRLQECEKCEHYDAPATRCKKCGCLMKTKTQLANSECPIGVWKKHT